MDEGGKVATATLDYTDGIAHETATQAAQKAIIALMLQGAQFLNSIGTPEIVAAMEMIRAGLGG